MRFDMVKDIMAAADFACLTGCGNLQTVEKKLEKVELLCLQIRIN